jgi:hypothetical protein
MKRNLLMPAAVATAALVALAACGGNADDQSTMDTGMGAAPPPAAAPAPMDTGMMDTTHMMDTTRMMDSTRDTSTTPPPPQ